MSRDVSTWGGGDETVVPDGEQPSVDASVWVGRYRIGALLGRGGSGQVHAATDLLTGRDVAVKFVSHLARGSARQLRRELTALRLLDLPGVVQLLDDGEEGGQTFLVMELLPGGRFDVLAGEGGWSDFAPQAVALLESLARVHFAGVLHRDLKPGNVLLDALGRPVITDFGLAMGQAVECHPSTVVEGTPRYMAPEQRRGEPSDERTDLYALGVMFDEMLRDRPAPNEVRAVVAAMCAEEPADRPAGVVDVLRAIGAGTESLLGSVQGLPEVASEEQLRALFDEPPVTFLHVAEDAAAVLHLRTGGRRDDVASEIERWVRAGRSHLADGRITLERSAVDGLLWEDDPELASLVLSSRTASEDVFAAELGSRADALHLQGRSARAAALLEAALGVVRGSDEARSLLEQLVCVALALFRDDVLRRAMYRAERAAATDLLGLVRGARLLWQGDAQRALTILSEPVTGEPELSRMAFLVQACAIAAPERLPRLVERSRELCADDEVRTGRWHSWVGNAAYRTGEYATAMDHAERSAALLTGAPVWQLGALTNAGAAALEIPDLPRAVAWAAEARRLARRLRAGLVETRAWWLERTARYRAGEELLPEDGWVDAAEAVSKRYAAQLAITEAAIARAHGAPETARQLGARAEALGQGNRVLTALGQALALGSGEVTAIDSLVDTSGFAESLQLQVAALRAEAGVAPSGMGPVADWAARWPLSDPDRRLDVLSLSECQAALGLTAGTG
ncbi:MAG: serine/threonine protein kinase [Myxococcales bacterium]|nr:serine/threonine protein kinase [Myxococcales bacterium]